MKIIIRSTGHENGIDIGSKEKCLLLTKQEAREMGAVNGLPTIETHKKNVHNSCILSKKEIVKNLQDGYEVFLFDKGSFGQNHTIKGLPLWTWWRLWL